MIDSEKFKNLFIVYPPSTGGTHISNLLSLHPSFNPKYQWDNYEATMFEKYIKMHKEKGIHSPRSANVHFSPNQKNINDYDEKDQWIFDLMKNDKKNVFTGHYTNFHNLFVNTRLRKFEPYVGLILTEPKVGSIPYIRNELNGFSETNTNKNYKLPCQFIGTYPSEGMDFITEENGFILETEKLFTREGFQILNNLLNENLGIQLDEKYNELHQYWYEIVTFYV